MIVETRAANGVRITFESVPEDRRTREQRLALLVNDAAKRDGKRRRRKGRLPDNLFVATKEKAV